MHGPLGAGCGGGGDVGVGSGGGGGLHWPVSLLHHAVAGTCRSCLRDERAPLSGSLSTEPGLQRGLRCPVSLPQHVVAGTCLKDISIWVILLKTGPRRVPLSR